MRYTSPYSIYVRALKLANHFQSAAINKSLTTLGKVIDAINRGDSRIPFRDCKLTRILSDVLGGESKGIMICCMAPGAKFAKDTYNTLEYVSSLLYARVLCW